MQAYIHSKTYRNDGNADSFHTQSVEVIEKPLWWQDKGLTYTATGYGKRIPTRYMVRYNGKMRRVYCCIYSNIGTLYIGNLKTFGEVLTVSIDN